GLIVVAAALGWAFDVEPLDRLAWEPMGCAWGVMATVPMLILFLLMNRYPLGPLRTIRRFLIEYLGPSLVACRWYELLPISCLAGIAEELLFRGVLHPLTGLVWSNVIFGLAHLVTPTYAVLAGLIGAYFGWLLDATGNLLAPMVAHGLYDFVALLVVAR